MRVNRGQLADILGISHPTVTAWVREGMPYTREGSRSAEWEFETRPAIEWMAANKLSLKDKRLAKGKSGAGADDDAPETIEEAERRKMVANADKAEVQVAKEAGILVPISEVANVVAEEHARVRARLLTIPNESRPAVSTYLAEDREAAEQLLAAIEETILEALSEIRSWAPGAEEPQAEPEPEDDEPEPAA